MNQPISQTNLSKSPRITAIGMLAWNERLDGRALQGKSGSADPNEILTFPVGTTAGIAVSMAHLGADVRLFGAVGADARGESLKKAFQSIGIETDYILTDTTRPTSKSGTSYSRSNTTPFVVFHPDARLERGSPVNIDALFDADICVIDIDDYELTRFLVDLPVHISPTIRLLGTLTYLAKSDVGSDVHQTLSRFDHVTGSIIDLCQILEVSRDDVIAATQRLILGSNLRSVFLTDGAYDLIGINQQQSITVSSPPGEFDGSAARNAAFGSAIAVAQSQRWDIATTLEFANAVVALSGGTPDVPSTFPSFDTVVERVRNQSR